MPVKLVELLCEDKVRLRGQGPELTAKCPFHADRTPSMSVNVDKGVYHCHGCGASGDAVTYLENKRGLSQKDALRAVKGEMRNPHQAKPRRKAQPRPRQPHWVPSLPNNAIARHRYLLGDGTLAFTICRFAKGPKCLPYTPARRNGKDGWSVELVISEGRPLYRLGEISQAPRGRQVMVVEGEKCADAVAAAFPKATVTSWAGGGKSWKRSDWSPLGGRRVLLISDADSEGRKSMLEIARHLKGLGCTDIRVALPEGEDHRDIADVIAEGGEQAARDWLRMLAAPWSPPEPTEGQQADSKQPKKKKKEEASPPPANVAENEHFAFSATSATALP